MSQSIPSVTIPSSKTEFALVISCYSGRMNCLNSIPDPWHKFWYKAPWVPEGAVASLGTQGHSKKFDKGAHVIFGG